MSSWGGVVCWLCLNAVEHLMVLDMLDMVCSFGGYGGCVGCVM